MPGFDALIDASWRERGFGDFWGYRSSRRAPRRRCSRSG